MSKFQVLIDSDAYIGFFLEKDAHHQKATGLFTHLRNNRARWVTTSLVVAEVATVLSRASGQTLANVFLKHVTELHSFPVIFISEDLFQSALKTFTKQQNRGTSVTDCANTVVMKQFEIPYIFSFDKAYAKNFGLTTVEQWITKQP